MIISSKLEFCPIIDWITKVIRFLSWQHECLCQTLQHSISMAAKTFHKKRFNQLMAQEEKSADHIYISMSVYFTSIAATFHQLVQPIKEVIQSKLTSLTSLSQCQPATCHDSNLIFPVRGHWKLRSM